MKNIFYLIYCTKLNCNAVIIFSLGFFPFLKKNLPEKEKFDKINNCRIYDIIPPTPSEIKTIFAQFLIRCSCHKVFGVARKLKMLALPVNSTNSFGTAGLDFTKYYKIFV